MNRNIDSNNFAKNWHRKLSSSAEFCLIVTNVDYSSKSAISHLQFTISINFEKI